MKPSVNDGVSRGLYSRVSMDGATIFTADALCPDCDESDMPNYRGAENSGAASEFVAERSPHCRCDTMACSVIE